MPKAVKRTANVAAAGAATAPPVGRVRKAAKLTPQEEQLQAVAAAVEAMAHLPDACRGMLLAAMPLSLGAPTDARHTVQDNVIGMIGDVLGKERATREASVARTGEEATAAEAKSAELLAAQSDAQSNVDGKTRVAEEKKAALDGAAVLLAEAKATLAAKQQEERAAKEAEVARREECAIFDAAVGAHFAPLKEGAWEEGALTGQQHVDALVATLHQAKLDSSVMASLRISGSKRDSERTNFDKMVLEQVASNLAEKANSLKKQLADVQPGLAQRSAAVAAQAAEVANAEAALQGRKSSFEQVDVERQESEAHLKRAAEQLSTCSAEAKRLAALRDAAKAELQLFADGPCAAFDALRDATPKAVEEAGAEASAASEMSVTTVSVGGA